MPELEPNPSIETAVPPEPKAKKGSAFWLTIVALVITTFLSALDLTAVSTALPTIVRDLKGGSDFVWVGSAYALSSTAFVPLSGKLADIFGRKPTMLISVALFALGSALSGASQNMRMLIAARTVQGIGGGSILNLVEIVVSDLVPLAERGLYQGIFGMTWAFASAIGPPIGGAIGQTAWRWLFFLNIPLCAIGFILVALFLNVRQPPGSFKEKFVRVDWLGNTIVIAGTTLTNIGLAWGGVDSPWTSAKVLVPLILGLVLLGVFLLYEFKVPLEPTIPYDVVSNRTSLNAFLSTALHGITSISIIYYLPIYFQASFGASPIRSGVDMLPTAFLIAPFAIVAGAMTQISNRYRPANYLGWGLSMVGFGLLSLLKADSSTGSWVGYQIVAGAGTGLLFASTVFAVLAPLPVERTAAALGLFAFSRSFAQTFGLTIASTILQNKLSKTLPAEFVSQFPEGAQIAFAAIPVIKDLPEPLRTEVRAAFATSMSLVWKVMIGVAGLGFLTLPFLKEIPMLTHTDEKFALQQSKKTTEEVMQEKTV
ncbi:major facilitator superfamily domain-containing protein [Mycena floridula]|nr:major facilitator superfamily domain-containing protein [Mycena floridula]